MDIISGIRDNHNVDPDKTDKKAFDIEDSKLQLQKRLEQRRVAKDCADWIWRKVDIRSVRYPGFYCY